MEGVQMAVLGVEEVEIDYCMTNDPFWQDFNNRNLILQRYKFIDEDLNVLFKGKVAMKAVGDRIIMTEFFFSGMLGELTD